ncbi:MAG: hypothetical protein IJA97_05455 [Clostridia bacterium]|nr:hypothetical protein [Clostridia bacterium]
MVKLQSNYNAELINIINEELSLTSTQTNTETQTEQAKININVSGKRFLSSFKYMGLGMLGIFLIISIIIIMVTVLNKIKKK